VPGNKNTNGKETSLQLVLTITFIIILPFLMVFSLSSAIVVSLRVIRPCEKVEVVAGISAVWVTTI
jgi:hypothetical protein